VFLEKPIIPPLDFEDQLIVCSIVMSSAFLQASTIDFLTASAFAFSNAYASGWSVMSLDRSVQYRGRYRA